MVGRISSFLSYSLEDEQFVADLHDSLLAVGAGPYVAEWDNQAGRPLEQKIREGIKNSTCVISVLTDASSRSAWVHEEIGYATALNKPVIPVRQKGTVVKGFLEGKEWIEFRPTDYRFTIYDIIFRVRDVVVLPAKIPRQQPVRALDNIHGKCRECGIQFDTGLPTQEEINEAISSGNMFQTKCKNGHEVCLDPYTFRVVPCVG